MQREVFAIVRAIIAHGANGGEGCGKGGSGETAGGSSISSRSRMGPLRTKCAAVAPSKVMRATLQAALPVQSRGDTMH